MPGRPVAQASIRQPGRNGHVSRQFSKACQAGCFEFPNQTSRLNKPAATLRLQTLEGGYVAPGPHPQYGAVMWSGRRYALQRHAHAELSAEPARMMSICGLLQQKSCSLSVRPGVQGRKSARHRIAQTVA